MIDLLCLPVVQTTLFQQQKFNHFSLFPLEPIREFSSHGYHYNKYNSHLKHLALISTSIPSNLHWKVLKISLIHLQKIAFIIIFSVHILSFPEKIYLLKTRKKCYFFSVYFTQTGKFLRKTFKFSVVHCSFMVWNVKISVQIWAVGQLNFSFH